MKILVTGAAGFIGSSFVRQVAKKDILTNTTEIVALDSLTYAANMENLGDLVTNGSINFIKGDIRNADLVLKACAGVDVVFHFAAESHVDRSIKSAKEFIETNIFGSQVLGEIALKNDVQRFVYISTDEVYGSIDEGSWIEESPVSPNSPYSASKAGGELILLALSRTHGLPVTVTRCSNNFGPFQNIEKLIPKSVTNLLARRTVPLYGDGLNEREWLYVEDHCRAVALVSSVPGSENIFNLPSGKSFTNVALLKTIAARLGLDFSQVVQFVADRKGHDRRYSMNCRKFFEFFPNFSVTPFESAIKDTISWYENNPEWWKGI
jgi:dTDP-glucose 4,6-dehydratase